MIFPFELCAPALGREKVIVENMRGRGGGRFTSERTTVAARQSAGRLPLMLTASIHHHLRHFLHSKLPYGGVKTLHRSRLVASGPLIVSTAPNVTGQTLKGVLPVVVRKDPAKFTFATSSLRLRTGTSRQKCSSETAGVDT